MSTYTYLFELTEVDMLVLEKHLKRLPLIDERIRQRRGALKWSGIYEDDEHIKQLERFKNVAVAFLNSRCEEEKKLIHLKFWQFPEELTWKEAIKMLGKENFYPTKKYRKSILTKLAISLGYI